MTPWSDRRLAGLVGRPPRVALRRQQQGRAACRQAGFTVVELLAVLVIVVLAGAVAYPRLGAAREQAALRATVLALDAQLRSARAAAVRTSTPQTVTIDMASRTYASSVEPRPRTLGGWLRVSLDGHGFETVGTSAGIISFQPDGSACDATIRVASGHRSAAVTIDWLTGATRIAWRL